MTSASIIFCLTAGVILGWGLTWRFMVMQRQKLHILDLHSQIMDEKFEKLLNQTENLNRFKIETMRFMHNPTFPFNSLYLSICFDPRELFFTAGFDYEKTRITQWSFDHQSAMCALEKFIADENAFTGTEVKACDFLKPGKKAIIGVDRDSLMSLEASVKEKSLTLSTFLADMLGINEVEIPCTDVNQLEDDR